MFHIINYGRVYVTKNRQEGAIMINFYGALIGLAIAIFLILRKLNPAAALMTGAVVGILIGGGNLDTALEIIIQGTSNISGITARVIAGGVLAGVLIGTGSVEAIALGIVNKLGEKRAILAITLSAVITSAIGVFITVGVMILAPIGLGVAAKTGMSKAALILALSGGAKAGNIISPNPNTVAAAGGFDLSLSEVMIGGLLPGLVGFISTIILANLIKNKGQRVTLKPETEEVQQEAPIKFRQAIVGPVVAMGLLVFPPVISMLTAFELHIDVLYVLPTAALIHVICLRKLNRLVSYVNMGMLKMMPIVFALIGAGAIGQMITSSTLPVMIADLIFAMGIPPALLAPISGAIMGFATGSTSTGVILATESFSSTLLYMGVAPLSAAVMVHAGSMVIDYVPHGNYVLASLESFKIEIKDRMKIMPYEALVGLSMAITAILVFG